MAALILGCGAVALLVAHRPRARAPRMMASDALRAQFARHYESDQRKAEALAELTGKAAFRAAQDRGLELFSKCKRRAVLDSTTTVEAELAVEAKGCKARAQSATARRRKARPQSSPR